MFEVPPPQAQLKPPPQHSWFWRHTMALSLTGLAMFLFLVATNTQSGWVYVIVACIAATLALCYVLAFMMVRQLNVTRSLESFVPCGDNARVVISITNTGRHPKFGVTVIEHFPATLPKISPRRRFYVNYLPAKSTAKFTYTLPCRQRGYHHFTELELESGFPLSLFYIKKKLLLSDWLCVSPRLLDTSRENLGTDNSQEAIRSLLRRGSSDNFYGLREYVYGDDLRFVHWPASARHRQLLVKEFQTVTSQKRLIIAIDPTRTEFLQTPQQEDLESALSIAATLSDWCAYLKIPLTLITLRQGQIKRGDADSRHEFLASIQGEPPYSQQPDLDAWLDQESERTPNCQCISISIPGSMQNPQFKPNFKHNGILRIICGPSPQKPSLYLAFSSANGQRRRHYLPLNGHNMLFQRFIPREKRQLARVWNPLITESYCDSSNVYLCGSKYLEDVFLWIIRSLR